MDQSNPDISDDDEEEEERKSDGEEDKQYGDNRELVQAQSYDRTFILNGPVVKVY